MLTKRQIELNEKVARLAREAKLESWSSFVEELPVPGDLAAGLMTGRPELIRTAPGRALTVEECRALYRLIAGLVETNSALQEHARELAKLVGAWGDSFKALRAIGGQIERFAEFKPVAEEEDVT
jgi:hypothetical protein